MNVFPKDKTITHFSSSMKASYNVDLGSTIQVESHDCYGGQVDSEKVLRPHIDLSIMNQATGPFFVNDLKKSDVLKLRSEERRVGKESRSSKGISHANKWQILSNGRDA